MPYVGDVASLSSIIAGVSGVALPVPRKRAVIGKATTLMKSSLIRNIWQTSFRGNNAKKISNQRMTFHINNSFRMSF